jgi:hypothetical protein
MKCIRCRICNHRITNGFKNGTCSRTCSNTIASHVAVRVRINTARAKRTLCKLPKSVAGAKWLPVSDKDVVLVDANMFDRLSLYTWSLWGLYAGTTVNKKRINLHQAVINIKSGREISYLPSDTEIDHKDGNHIDNRYRNLRVSTRSQNQHNKRKQSAKTWSKYKGVSLDISVDLWVSRIRINKRNTFIGRFLSEREAAKAYDEAARKHYGVFACTNFPRGDERPALKKDTAHERG